MPTRSERSRALEAVRSLSTAAGVKSVEAGESLSVQAADFDWILDVQLADEGAAHAFLAGEAYREMIEVVGGATKDEWTARVTHLMRGT